MISVKDLEWREFKALGGRTKLVAHDCFGEEFARIDLPQLDETIDAFKADRQAYYETRIRSALTVQSVGEPVALPKFIAGWTAPFHVTMDGIKDSKGCWICSATNNKLAHELVELMNFAAAHAIPVPALAEGMRKIYLASRYSRFPEMQSVRADLEALGYTVTSRWINGGHELTKEGSTEVHEQERVRYAQEDFADLLAADCVISFTEVPRETKTRGGRHVEHGMALALGKRTIVVGYRENVFHCLPQCEYFATWGEALAALPTAAEGRKP